MPWLRLGRISALPSAVSNVLMGFLLAHGCWSNHWAPNLELIALILSSCSLYIAGMILNDYFDLAVDKIERPQRPIPSGQISKQHALLAGIGLLVAGIGFALLAGWQSPHESLMLKLRPGLVAIALAGCILLYDGLLKKTILAPALMGGCRTLNVLLGASTIALNRDPNETFFGFPLLVWSVAFVIGIFIAGVTLLARKEATVNHNRKPLIMAGIMIALGLAGIAFVYLVPSDILKNPTSSKIYPFVILLISFPIIRRVIAATSGLPSAIQTAVIVCLRSVIILDACMCFLFAPGEVGYAIAVLALLIPGLLLSRLIPPT